ncbi:MAG: hypothetical protein RBU37_25530 [Myxococcota bacterium]|jgi:hypothetical protein|nr:hypothetical protein [Myxococcota bacterium]
MKQESFLETFGELELSTEQLQQILEQSKASMGMDMDQRQWGEAKRLLSRSQEDMDHFDRIQTMQVKDYHVWSIKKPELREELAEQLNAERESMKEASDELEASLDRLKSMHQTMLGLYRSYGEFANEMQKASQDMQQSGLNANQGLEAVQREIMPAIERLLYRFERIIDEFKKELEQRLRMMDFLGRQISALRDEPLFYPVKSSSDLDDEPPPDEEGEKDGPSQAEALLDEQNELEQGVHEQDRGRKDERRRGAAKKKDKGKK